MSESQTSLIALSVFQTLAATLLSIELGTENKSLNSEVFQSLSVSVVLRGSAYLLCFTSVPHIFCTRLNVMSFNGFLLMGTAHQFGACFHPRRAA